MSRINYGDETSCVRSDGSGHVNSVQNPRGYLTTNVYDARDLVARIDALGFRTTMAYDALGRQVAVQTPLGYRSTTVYDAAGQTAAEIDALGYRTSFGYDAAGNRVTMMDANGYVSTSVYYNSANLQQAQIDALGRRTTFSLWDVNGRLVGKTEPSGWIVTTGWDALGRSRAVANELNYRTTFAYLANSWLESRLDALGRRITYSYDAVGGQTGIQYNDGSRVTYAYDRLGRRTTMVDWGGTTTHAYDARSEPVGKTDPGNLVQAYAYDSVGNRTLLVDPDGGLHSYTYDELNRGATYQKPTNQLYTQQYDADSRPTTLLMGLGTRELCQYDPAGRLTTLIQQKSDGTPLLTVVDTYDPGGRKTVSTRDGVPATYSYDKASRLLGQTKASQVATFSYDATDNVLVKWHQGQAPISMSYDAANRLVTSVQGPATTTYTFDGVGNLTQEALGAGSSLYSYDGENRLVKYTAADLSVTTMTYEGDSLRRSKQVQGSVPTTFVWDGTDYLIEKSGNSTSALYSVFNGQVVSEARGGTSLDYLKDTLGSTAALADATQALSDTWQYWPYGEIAEHLGSSNTPLTWVGTLGYYLDLLDKLYYIRARYERPDLARWLTVDPMWPREPSYTYPVSPVWYIDPSGEQTTLLLCLLTCWGYPGGPCAWAKDRGLDQGDYGGVICCNGVKHACAWNLPPGTRPGVAHCLKEHEREHFDDIPCTHDGRPLPYPNTPLPDEECRGYSREILCYTDARARECGKLSGPARKQCEDDYRWWICDACRAARIEGCTPSQLPRQCRYCP